MKKIEVWDAPQRVLHILLAAGFAGAWLTAESERWRALHVALGYLVAVAAVLRILWGFAGTRHARFAAFVRGPRAASGYLRALARGRAPHHTGHNPAGGLAILGLLGLALLVTASGWVALQDGFGESIADAHEALAGAMAALVGLHLAGVLVGSLAHREFLPLSMITGRKRGAPDEAIGNTRPVLGALVLAICLAFAFAQLPSPVPAPRLTASAASFAAAPR